MSRIGRTMTAHAFVEILRETRGKKRISRKIPVESVKIGTTVWEGKARATEAPLSADGHRSHDG